MTVHTVTEAKAHLSELLERVSRGEEVIIGRAGKPVAILEPYRPAPQARQPGKLRGQITLAPDFDVLPPEWVEAFGSQPA